MSNCQKQSQSKIRKLEDKVARLEKDLKKKRKENRSLKKSKKHFQQSRDNWKAKNREKRLNNKQLQAKLDRLGKPKRYRYDLVLIALCIQLRILGGCSYQSIRRIMVILQCYFQLNTSSIPCANTVENWVSKMGLFHLQNTANRFKDKEVCLIIDESAKTGKEKTLLVLACQAEKLNKKALSYSDVQVCHLEGKNSWTGAEISKVIRQLHKKLTVRYVISDRASNLKCGIRLSNTVNLPDISHVIASCLQKTFEKTRDYQCFIRQMNAYQAKSVNQDLSYLRPPKQRIKARFMNQGAIVKWAADMLTNFQYLSKEEQIFFEALPKHMGIISTMLQCLQVAKQIGTLFKIEGLSITTLRKATNLLKQYPFLAPKFKELLLSYLSDYEALVSMIGVKGKYHVCSDVIESLFGTYKEKMSSNKQVGLSILALELATYATSTEQFEQQVKQSLESISMAKLEQWKTTHMTENQASRRAAFFKNCPSFLNG